MNFRSNRLRRPALFFLLLFFGLILVSCQENTEIPWATVSAPPATNTPKPHENSPAVLPPTNTPTVIPDSTQVTTKTLRGKTIEFWHSWQGELAKEAEDAAAEFNRTNQWGLTVKVKPFYSIGALDDAVEAGIKDPSTGLPQAIAAPGEQLAVWSEKYGILSDLNGYVQDQKFGMSQNEINSFSPIFWNQDRVGEKKIGIPALRTAWVIFYNETWAKELGFSNPPKTPEEFKKQACAAAKKNNAAGYLEKYGTGGWIIDDDALTTLSWLTAFGAQPIPDAEGKPYRFQSPEAGKAITFLRGMLDDGCAWQPRNPVPYEYFGKRMALFYTGTLPDGDIQNRWQNKLKNADKWRILPFMSEDGKPVVYGGGPSYAVLKSDPDTELAAWLFLRFLETPAIAVKLTKALPSIPVSSAISEQLSGMENTFPWKDLLPVNEQVRAAPTLPSWSIARRLLEDAGWQVYHIPVDQILQILPDLDQAILDISTIPNK
jgi:multiple sugar transport system substrate-binding protein